MQAARTSVYSATRRISPAKQTPDLSSIPHTITKYLKTGAKNEPAHIAFYGGSFTALPQETQKAYLEAARPFIRSGQVNDVRLSTRPDCITEEILSLLGRIPCAYGGTGRSVHGRPRAHPVRPGTSGLQIPFMP